MQQTKSVIIVPVGIPYSLCLPGQQVLNTNECATMLRYRVNILSNGAKSSDKACIHHYIRIVRSYQNPKLVWHIHIQHREKMQFC